MALTKQASGGIVALWFILLSCTWGSSFLFIKLALDGMGPAAVVLFRLVLGAITLLVIAAIRRRQLPREWRLIGHLAVVAFFLCVLPLLLFAWAGESIPSGLSAIYNATTPLMTMVISLGVIPNERLGSARATGVIVGAIGILVVLGPWTLLASGEDLSGSLLPQLACLLGTASYGLAFAWMRRFVTGKHSYDAPTVAATQVALAALMMLVPAPLILSQPIDIDPTILVSIIILGVFGSGVAYIWNTIIVNAWGATPASTVTYVSPLVGVALGIVVLGESLSWNEPVGGVIAVIGILMSQGVISIGRKERKARSDADLVSCDATSKSTDAV